MLPEGAARKRGSQKAYFLFAQPGVGRPAKSPGTLAYQVLHHPPPRRASTIGLGSTLTAFLQPDRLGNLLLSVQFG